MFDVVYVDDEPQLCIIFERIFSTSTVNFKSFTNHEEALKSIEASPPGLIFLDYRLEAVNGEDVARKIKPGIPIILVTGELNAQVTFPFERIITKPVNPEVIQKLIEEFQKNR